MSPSRVCVGVGAVSSAGKQGVHNGVRACERWAHGEIQGLGHIHLIMKEDPPTNGMV